jgi:hypothetical protein
MSYLLTPADIHAGFQHHGLNEFVLFADDICTPHELFAAGLNVIVHRSGIVALSGDSHYGKGGGCLNNESSFAESVAAARRLKGGSALWELAGLGVYGRAETPSLHSSQWRSPHFDLLSFVIDPGLGPFWLYYHGPLEEWLHSTLLEHRP